MKYWLWAFVALLSSSSAPFLAGEPVEEGTLEITEGLVQRYNISVTDAAKLTKLLWAKPQTCSSQVPVRVQLDYLYGAFAFAEAASAQVDTSGDGGVHLFPTGELSEVSTSMLFRSPQLYAGHGDAWLADPSTAPCALADCGRLMASTASLSWQAASLTTAAAASASLPGLGATSDTNASGNDTGSGGGGGNGTAPVNPDDVQGLPEVLDTQAQPPSMLPGKLANPQLLMYYRHDLFLEHGLAPPTTWADLADWAEALNGTIDADGDGATDWALCLDTTYCKSGFVVLAMMASAVQPSTEYGTFFHPENMYPLVGSTAFVETLRTFRRLARFSAPTGVESDPLACRPHDPGFTAGRCLLTLAFDQLRALAEGTGSGNGSSSGGGGGAAPPAARILLGDASNSSASGGSGSSSSSLGVAASASAASAASRRGALPPGALGVAPLPGSEAMYDRDAYVMAPCTSDSCPNAVNTTCAVKGDYRQRRPCLVNRAPVVASLPYEMVAAPYNPAAATSRLASLVVAMEAASSSWFGALARTLATDLPGDSNSTVAPPSGDGGGSGSNSGNVTGAPGRRRLSAEAATQLDGPRSVEEWTSVDPLVQLGASAEEAARYLAVYWPLLLGPEGEGPEGEEEDEENESGSTTTTSESGSNATSSAPYGRGPHLNVVSELRIRGSSHFTFLYAQAAAWVVQGNATPLQASWMALSQTEELLSMIALNRTRLSYKYCADIGWTGEYGPHSDASGSRGGLSGGQLAAVVTASVASAVLGGVLLALGVMAMRRWRSSEVLGPPGPGLGTTLLLTDIQNSTVLWETLPADVMDVALRCHHEVLRGLLAGHRGYESATEGDAFILAFHSAEDAANYAVAAQERLVSAVWPEEMLSHPDCEVVWVAPQRSDPTASLSYVSKELLSVMTRAVQTGMGVAALQGGGGGAAAAAQGGAATLRGAGGGRASGWNGLGSGSFAGGSAALSSLGSVISMFTSLWRQQGSSACCSGGSAGEGASASAAAAAAGGPAPLAPKGSNGRGARGGSDGGGASGAATGGSPTSSGRRRPLDLLVQAARTHSLSGGSRTASMNAGAGGCSDCPAATAKVLPPPPLAALQRLSPLGKAPSDIRSYMTDSEEALEDAAPGAPGAAAAAAAGSAPAGGQVPAGGGAGGSPGSAPAVSSLTEALRHGWRRHAPPGGSSGDAGGEQLLAFRGMRVRMGLHTGADLNEVSLNKATGRTQYSGAFMTAAKTVCDAAHGGQVLLSAATFKRLPPGCLAKSAFLLHMGEHATGDEGAAATAAAARARTLRLTANLAAAAAAEGKEQQGGWNGAAAAAEAAAAAAEAAEPAAEALYQLLPYVLSCRLPFFDPLRTRSYLSLGLPDAPVGRVTVVFMYVIGAQALLAWNPVVAGEALALFQDTVSNQLSAADGYVVELVDGLCLATFRSAADALLWSLRCGRLLLDAPWSEELLEHELCEEVSLPLHAEWAEPAPPPALSPAQTPAAAYAEARALVSAAPWRDQSEAAEAAPGAAATPAAAGAAGVVHANGAAGPRAPAQQYTLTRATALRYKTIMRGLRLKVGMDTGLVADTINATTGRMAYRGRPMNRAARIASRAHAGGVHCSAAVWGDAAGRLALLARSGGEDEVTATSLGLQSLKGVIDKIEVMSVSYKGAALSAEEAAVVARRGPRASSGSGAFGASSPGGLLSGLASAFSLNVGGGGFVTASAGSGAASSAAVGRTSARASSVFNRASNSGRPPSAERVTPSRPSPTQPIGSVSAKLSRILRAGGGGTGNGDTASDASVGGAAAASAGATSGGDGRCGNGLQYASSEPLPRHLLLAPEPSGGGGGAYAHPGLRFGTSLSKSNLSVTSAGTGTAAAAARSATASGDAPGNRNSCDIPAAAAAVAPGAAAAATVSSPRLSVSGSDAGGTGLFGSCSSKHVVLHVNPLHEPGPAPAYTAEAIQPPPAFERVVTFGAAGGSLAMAPLQTELLAPQRQQRPPSLGLESLPLPPPQPSAVSTVATGPWRMNPVATADDGGNGQSYRQ